MAIFNIFRKGYELGNQHGRVGERRRADWELRALTPVSWLPGVDSKSFLDGYNQGFVDGIAARHLIAQVRQQL